MDLSDRKLSLIVKHVPVLTDINFDDYPTEDPHHSHIKAKLGGSGIKGGKIQKQKPLRPIFVKFYHGGTLKK